MSAPDWTARAALVVALGGTALAAALVVGQIGDAPARVAPADAELVVRGDYRAGWQFADDVYRFPDTAPGWPLDANGVEAACREHLNHRPAAGPDRPSWLAGCIDRTRQETTP